MKDRWVELYDELSIIAKKVYPHYSIDKIKPYGVFIWTVDENDDLEYNVFDIEEDEIIFYDKKHVIKEEVLPIIKEIQEKIKQIRVYSESIKIGGLDETS